MDAGRSRELEQGVCGVVAFSPHDLCGHHFGICRLLCLPRGFYFLLFDIVVTEAQQAGCRRPGSFS